MSYEFRVIDAFADRPFSGNPAAVVLLTSSTTDGITGNQAVDSKGNLSQIDWPASDWLQNIAMEMNLSETSFLIPIADGYQLRWFTPNIEVDLCGHATLAAAAALADMGKLPDGHTVGFDTRSGRLNVTRSGDQYLLDFPIVVADPTTAPDGLLPALGIHAARSISKNKFDYLVELESQAMIEQLKPNFTQLAAIECRGIIVTAPSHDDRFDFVSRFFAPAAGINEDPVTGSAHCSLADYWSKRLHKQSLVGHQISPRGGVVSMQIVGDRVILGGRACLFSRGTFLSAGKI